MLNFLPPHAIEAIDRYDWVNYRSKPHPQFTPVNRTRFYKYLLANGADMEIHTVAVKTRKDKTVSIKEVVRASVDDPWVQCKDIAFYTMAGYMVDWSREGMGSKCYGWGYDNSWSKAAYSRTSGLFKLHRQVINPDALLDHPRFKYCSWNPDCGHILDYLKAYVDHPKIELLSKIGAGYFSARTGFLSQIEKDKNLMRFFMANLDEIKRKRLGVDAIRIAYKRGITLLEAEGRIKDRRAFWGCGLPSVVDATRAATYIEANKVPGEMTYCEYLQNCTTLGMDIRDTKVAFPKRFNARNTIVKDRIQEIKRQKDAELARKMDEEIAAVAKRFSKFERSRSGFKVMLPRKADDLVREGKRLANCLGDGHYASKMARGETVVAFIRKSIRPGKAFVAVEYSVDLNKVLQCYASKNQKPPKPVMDFVNRTFKRKVAA